MGSATDVRGRRPAYLPGTAGATNGAAGPALAGTAEPLPASSRTQEVNVAAAASVAIQRDLMNFNMWGVLFASIYPRKTPTFESSNVISSAADAGLDYSKLGIRRPYPTTRGRPENGGAAWRPRRDNEKGGETPFRRPS